MKFSSVYIIDNFTDFWYCFTLTHRVKFSGLMRKVGIFMIIWVTLELKRTVKFIFEDLIRESMLA